MKVISPATITNKPQVLWLLLISVLIPFLCTPLLAQDSEPEADKATLNETFIAFPSGGGFKESETETPTGEKVTALQSIKSLFLSDGTNVDLVMQTAKESTGGEALELPSEEWDLFIEGFIGMVMPMAYMPDRLNSGWIPCDGRKISVALHPKLYQAIGYSYALDAAEAVDANFFRVPDLRQKYIYSLPSTITVVDDAGTTSVSDDTYIEVSPTLFDPYKYQATEWPKDEDDIFLNATNVLFTFGPQKVVTALADTHGGGTVKSLGAGSASNDRLDVEFRTPNHTHLLQNTSVVELEQRSISSGANHSHSSVQTYSKGPNSPTEGGIHTFTLTGNEGTLIGVNFDTGVVVESSEDSDREYSNLPARIYGSNAENQAPAWAGVWKHGTGISSQSSSAHTHKLLSGSYSSYTDGEAAVVAPATTTSTPRDSNEFQAFNTSTGTAYPNINLDERDISKEYNANSDDFVNEPRPSTAVVMFCIFSGEITVQPSGYDGKVFSTTTNP